MGGYVNKINVLLLEYHYDDSLIKNYDLKELNSFWSKKFKMVSKNKMLYEKDMK